MKLEKILQQPENRKLEFNFIQKNHGRFCPAMTDYGQLRTIMDNYGRLTLEEKEILFYLLDNGKITRKKATEILNVQNTKVYEILSPLVEKNLIQREVKVRSTYYILKEGNNE